MPAFAAASIQQPVLHSFPRRSNLADSPRIQTRLGLSPPQPCRMPRPTILSHHFASPFLSKSASMNATLILSGFLHFQHLRSLATDKRPRSGSCLITLSSFIANRSVRALRPTLSSSSINAPSPDRRPSFSVYMLAGPAVDLA
ncbi:hypothetical protein LIA77_10211 [Sarocladium implicatum]|nr:hypothetical protein LIA77_10211 [Sarocladium implicatum]